MRALNDKPHTQVLTRWELSTCLYEQSTTFSIPVTQTEEWCADLYAELMDELFIDDLQRVGTTALSKLFAILESQLVSHNHELMYLRLEAWCGPDDAADRLLETFV